MGTEDALVLLVGGLASWGYSHLLPVIRVAWATWWDTWMEVVIGNGMVVAASVVMVLAGGWPDTWLRLLIILVVPHGVLGLPIVIWQVREEVIRRRDRRNAERAELRRQAARPRVEVDPDA